MPQATFLGGYLFNWNFGYFSIGIDNYTAVRER